MQRVGLVGGEVYCTVIWQEKWANIKFSVLIEAPPHLDCWACWRLEALGR